MKKIYSKILFFQYQYILKKFKPKFHLIIGDFRANNINLFLNNFLVSKKNLTIIEKVPSNKLEFFNLFINKGKDSNFLSSQISFLNLLIFKIYPAEIILNLNLDLISKLDGILNSQIQNLILIGSEFSQKDSLKHYSEIFDLLNQKSEIFLSTDFISKDDLDFIQESFRGKLFKFGLDFSEDKIAFLNTYKINYQDNLPISATFEISLGKEELALTLNNFLGRHLFYDLMPLLIFARFYNLSLADMILEMKNKNLPIKFLNKVNQATIFFDSSLNSPLSIKSAILNLKEIQIIGRKILILTDIEDFKFDEIFHHKQIANLIESQDLDLFLSIGFRSRLIFEELKGKGIESHFFINYTDLIKFINQEIKPNDFCLIKGHQEDLLKSLKVFLN